MMRTIFIIALLFRFAVSGDVWVKEVLDANLFLLSDGQKVQMGNIAAPSLSDPDSAKQAQAKAIRKYIRLRLERNGNVEVVFTGFRSESGYPLVYFLVKYPLEKRNLNIEFLKSGYGRFVDNAGTKYKTAAEAAQSEAQKFKRGIWADQPFRKKKTPYRVSFSGTFFYSESGDDRDIFQGLWFSLRPQKEEHGLLFSGGIARHVESGTGCCECDWSVDELGPLPAYHHISVPYFLQAGGQFVWHYVGINVGLTYFRLGDLYCSGAPELWVLPFANLRLGLMKEFYLTAAMWHDFLIPYSWGAKYYIQYPDAWLWVGGWKSKSKPLLLGVEAGYPLGKQFQLTVKATHYLGDQQLGLSIGIAKLVFIEH